MGDPLNIQIVFVSPDGEETNGPLLTPSIESLPQVDDTAWDKDQSVSEFRRFLETDDKHGLEAAVRALNRFDCWHEALEQFKSSPSPDNDLGARLLSLWITHGFRIAASLKGSFILLDVIKRLVLPYAGPALKLYRGELKSRYEDGICGMSWTPDLEVARMFARRRFSDEGPGVVLAVEATSDMIVTDAGGHTKWLGEGEYILDPRLIGAAISVVG